MKNNPTPLLTRISRQLQWRNPFGRRYRAIAYGGRTPEIIGEYPFAWIAQIACFCSMAPATNVEAV